MERFDNFFKYHMNTKHSYFSVRNNPNRLDWNNQPTPFKYYPNSFIKYELDFNCLNHDFIYHIAGISAKKSYPGVEYYLRINPSAGALYPNELYFQSRGNDSIKDGIYHFDIVSSSITLLKEIDENVGIEPYFNLKNGFKGFIFLISAVYYRSSWKYKNRAFRYCLLDSGHILGSIEASSYLFEKDYFISYDFDKKSLNELFGFDNKEFFLSSVFCGDESNKRVHKVDLDLPLIDGSYYFEKNELIEDAYSKSIYIQNACKNEKKPICSFNKEVYKDIVKRRRSIREFSKSYILKSEFESIINFLVDSISSDCDEDLEIFAVINRVESMKLGLINLNEYLKNETYIKEGDFKSKAGYLCLEQDLGSSSSVTFFITSRSKNYQAMYQKAGVIGHRLYLVSNYLRIGCSGIGAYYDDEVCEFLGEYTQVLYALAIGK